MTWTPVVTPVSVTPSGATLPAPGASGNVLVSNGAVWESQPPSGAADANAEQAFTNSTGFTFTHNLGKRPAIRVEDATGREWVVTVRHIDDNAAALSWSQPLTGTAFAN